MDSPCGRLLMIFILAYLFSDFARSLKNDDNPSDSKALGISRRERDSTQVKEILPVEVNVGGLVNFFNGQIQKLGDNVTRLDNQLQIIKGNEERNRAELKRSRNEIKLLKEEIYRLKNESTSIKAENERLKMKLEAVPHKTGIPQGTTSRPKAIVLMQNSGTPGATSSLDNDCLPEYAFQNAPGYSWMSKFKVPQSIWMQFAAPQRIAKLGFFCKYNSIYAPRSFDIVGSSNCGVGDSVNSPNWTVLLHVANDRFGLRPRGSDIFKTWTVPQQNRRGFRCIGLKIDTTYAQDEVALKNIQMWEEV